MVFNTFLFKFPVIEIKYSVSISLHTVLVKYFLYVGHIFNIPNHNKWPFIYYEHFFWNVYLEIISCPPLFCYSTPLWCISLDLLRYISIFVLWKFALLANSKMRGGHSQNCRLSKANSPRNTIHNHKRKPKQQQQVILSTFKIWAKIWEVL